MSVHPTPSPGEQRWFGDSGEAVHPVGSPRLPPAAGRFRRLRLRGGELDGLGWAGDIDVGKRVACGSGRWSPQSVYVVTDKTTRAPDGHIESIAIPAAF